ncbi:MAG: carboxypeptidase regulatory-like domain-containing protein [Alcanivoracaceae bacterium]|nr:carboxypeptidase regulatory-like domain-containing protein [Alcanivoracaceae bacterium]
MKLRYSVKAPWAVSMAAAVALVLSGCGGGSGGGAKAPTLSGTAAVGAAIVGGTVTARCADGNTFTEVVTTDANGNWTGTLTSGTMPCALQITGGTPPDTLYSYASSTGTVNITPLTTLALAQATGQTPADWFNAFSGTPVDVISAVNEVLDAMSDTGFDVPANGNPFTTSFVADGTGWDGLLDDLRQAINDDPALADLDALVTLVKDGNLNSSIPDAPAPPSYSIEGSISGASDGLNVIWETRVDGFIYHDGGNANGPVTFTYGDGLAEGTVWSVVINSAPAGQTCTVTNGSGTLTADVSNVSITCSDVVVGPTDYSISGTISGASGTVSWENRVGGVFYHDGFNGNGAVAFTYGDGLASGSSWAVVVTGAPAGQTCNVSNGSGTLAADVSNVAITCSDIVVGPTSYSIEGSISGASATVHWQTLVDDEIYHSGSSINGAVTFTPVEEMPAGSVWSVLVSEEPVGQNCNVANGSGTLSTDIFNVSISCQNEGGGPDPEAPIYDFSALNLQPSVPVGMVPTAPAASPTNPAGQIQALFMQLGDAERAKVFAAPPVELLTEVNNDVYSSSQVYDISQYATDQSWLRQIRMSFGADGEANTPDDFVQAYTVYPYGYNGVAYSFTHPGPDGMWFSEDDVAGEHNTGKAVYFPTGAVLEYEGASEGAILIIPCLNVGSDAVAFTADDSPGCTLGYQIAVIDGEGNRGQLVSYDAAGTDGLWFTADDRVKNYSLLTYNGTGVSVGSVLYNNDGVDNIWFTADDNVQQHTMTLLGDDFKPRYTATYNNRGVDNAWFTADDVVQAWSYYGYDAQGNNILVASHTSKGGDAAWFTADDSATAVISLKDENGYPIIAGQITSGGMGPDGIWLSGDETLFGYSLSEYRADGFQTSRADINGRGADNKWFTADDQPNSFNYWIRDYDAEGNIIEQFYFDPSLAPAESAFSDAHMTSYEIYNQDRSLSVYVYRNQYGSSFGADETPFTEDDTLGTSYYSVETAGGRDRFNMPGPDGVWFTGDDVRSAYVVYSFDGLRRTEQQFDASDVMQSYTEIVDISPTSYRLNAYFLNESDVFELGSYNIIDEDINGYPLWISYYTNTDVLSYVEYAERDAAGNIVRQSYSFAPGDDGIWATSDDFSYYSLYFFNMNDELVSAGTERVGADGEWGTGDDTVSTDWIYLLENDIDVLALNAGNAADVCGSLISGIGASGDINVLVRDQNGAPLPGVIAQLNQSGATVTTDANGEAVFAGLNGTQDVHLFKDGHEWESFYCVAPGADVTLQASLNSLSQAAQTSKVSFYIQPTDKRVTLRLLDAQGRSVATFSPLSSPIGQANTFYGDLFFNVPAGTEVSGELWVFEADTFGRLQNAQSLGAQTYTTIASNLNPGVVEREQITVSLPASDIIPVAFSGTLVGVGDNFTSLHVSLGGLYSLPFQYEGSLNSQAAVVPGLDVALPVTAQPTAVWASSDSWTAWYPGVFPEIGTGTFLASIITGFQYPVVIATQEDSSATPQISWVPATQRDSGQFISVNTIELHNAAGGSGYQSHWTIHTPPGESQLTLPSLPVGITGPALPQSSYSIIVKTRAVPAKGYHDLIGSEDLYDLDPALATEVLTSSDVFSAPKLMR